MYPRESHIYLRILICFYLMCHHNLINFTKKYNIKSCIIVHTCLINFHFYFYYNFVNDVVKYVLVCFF